MPFRILAVALCLTGVVGISGMGYMAWHGDRALQVKDVVMLPGMLWFGRLMLLAALGGTRPPQNHLSQHDHWPFATGRVFGFYSLIVFLFVFF